MDSSGSALAVEISGRDPSLAGRRLSLDLADDDLAAMLSESTGRPQQSAAPSKGSSRHHGARRRILSSRTEQGAPPLERVYELISILEDTLAEAKVYRDSGSTHDPWSPYEPFRPAEVDVVPEHGGNLADPELLSGRTAPSTREKV